MGGSCPSLFFRPVSSQVGLYLFSTDFVKQDVKRLFNELLPLVNITLVEAGPALLGPFDSSLQEYALGLFKKREVDVRLETAVIGVEDFKGDNFRFPGRRAMLSDGSTLEFGTMVWSAGLAPRSFTETLDNVLERHPRNKRIIVDEHLRVKGHEGSIWAMGDAAINEKGVPIPQLAQVARQQGLYLADVFNEKIKEDEKPFNFFSLGSMAFMGDNSGIYDGSTIGAPRESKEGDAPASWFKSPKITGFLALLVWRFAYWGRQTSIQNKVLIPVLWAKSYLFGRDVTRY
jgi:NADH dehydrogenase FAD-containing subunit